MRIDPKCTHGSSETLGSLPLAHNAQHSTSYRNPIQLHFLRGKCIYIVTGFHKSCSFAAELHVHVTYVLLGTGTVQIPGHIYILLVPLGVQSPPQGRGTVGEGGPEPLCTHSQNHTSSWSDRDSAMSGTLREGGMTERVKEGE